MHIPTHILSGWCIGNCFAIGKRERLFCMVAAAIADLDGLGIIFSEETYWRFHHSLGHNVFYGSFIAAGMATFSKRRFFCFSLFLALFHLHLLMDYYGSGPGWAIHYFWPFNRRGWKTDLAWSLAAWQNYLTFGALLIWTFAIAKWNRRTPLERIAPRLDQALIERGLNV